MSHWRFRMSILNNSGVFEIQREAQWMKMQRCDACSVSLKTLVNIPLHRSAQWLIDKNPHVRHNHHNQNRCGGCQSYQQLTASYSRRLSFEKINKTPHGYCPKADTDDMKPQIFIRCCLVEQ